MKIFKALAREGGDRVGVISKPRRAPRVPPPFASGRKRATSGIASHFSRISATSAPALLTALAILLGLAQPALAAAAPKVLASILPVHSIAAAVMEGAGTPALLVAGGADPHAYALKPSDARALTDAEVVFWIGPAMETFLERPLAALASEAHVVALMRAEGVRVLPARAGGLWDTEAHEFGHDHEDATADGHIWLDPVNGAAMAHAMARALSAEDPPRAALYTGNAERFAARMAALSETLARDLAPAAERPYIVFHDAYRYFEAHFGLQAVGAVTVAAGRPPGARRVRELRDRIAGMHGLCVFSGPQFPPRLMNTLITGTDARTGVLDELGAGIAPGPGLYETLLRQLAGDALACLVR